VLRAFERLDQLRSPGARARVGLHDPAIDLSAPHRTPVENDRRRRLEWPCLEAGEVLQDPTSAATHQHTPLAKSGRLRRFVAVPRAPRARACGGFSYKEISRSGDSAGHGDVAALPGPATAASELREPARRTRSTHDLRTSPAWIDAYLDGELSVAATLQAREPSRRARTAVAFSSPRPPCTPARPGGARRSGTGRAPRSHSRHSRHDGSARTWPPRRLA